MTAHRINGKTIAMIFNGMPKLDMDAEYIDLEEDVFVDGDWPAMNKQNTIDEYVEECTYGDVNRELTKINRIVFLVDPNYEDFTNSFMTNRDFLGEGRGGSSSFFESDKENFWDLTEEERAEYREYAYTNADLVVNIDTKERVLVNQEGHGYARYVGFVKNEHRWAKMLGM